MFGKHARRIALLVAAAAIAAPATQAVGSPPKPESLATASGFLAQQRMPASRIGAWTAGVCSHAVKPGSCYVTPAEATLASERSAEGFLGTQSYQSGQPESLDRGGFDWADAGIGAGITGGMALLIAALGASLAISRQNHRRPARRS